MILRGHVKEGNPMVTNTKLHTKYVKIAQTFFSQKNLNQGVLNTSEPDIQVFYHRTCDPTL